jgi:hypothetical protein
MGVMQGEAAERLGRLKVKSPILKSDSRHISMGPRGGKGRRGTR